VFFFGDNFLAAFFLWGGGGQNKGKFLDYFSSISLNNFSNFFGKFSQICNITKMKFINPDHDFSNLSVIACFFSSSLSVQLYVVAEVAIIH
jgi:hypothetical protein